MVEYFRRIQHTEIAVDIAKRFVNTVYSGWVNTNYIFEKYNADELGVYGGGGEYVVQEGFGWTNGVVIKFIEWFGDELKLEPPQAAVAEVIPEEPVSIEAVTESLAHTTVSETGPAAEAESASGSDETSVDEVAAAMASAFAPEEQVKRRMSEVISNQISNEISISIQQMEI